MVDLKGKTVPSLSLEPIAKKLSDLLKKKVIFLNEVVGSKVVEESKKISNGEILLLENLRFHKEEELNSKFLLKNFLKLEIYM